MKPDSQHVRPSPPPPSLTLSRPPTGVHDPRIEHGLGLPAHDDGGAAGPGVGHDPQVQLERDVLRGEPSGHEQELGGVRGTLPYV